MFRRGTTTKWVTLSATWLMSLSTLSAGMTARADEVLDDLTGRIEYAFYAGDSRILLQSWQQLDALQVAAVDAAVRDNYLNYGRWKAAQLLAASDPEQAERYALACVDFKPTLKTGALLATQHALVAACYGMLETLRPVRRVLYRGDREAALQRALQTHAATPQVLFIAAWLSSRLETADKAYPLLTKASNSFGAADNAGRGNAGWGYAETCYLLGKLELARGNVLAARNSLEQALVQAPDYRDAQQLLQSLRVN